MLLSFVKKLRPLPLFNPIEVLASMGGDLEITWLGEGTIDLTAISTAPPAEPDIIC